jgi:hypothetical protein
MEVNKKAGEESPRVRWRITADLHRFEHGAVYGSKRRMEGKFL